MTGHADRHDIRSRLLRQPHPNVIAIRAVDSKVVNDGVEQTKNEAVFLLRQPRQQKHLKKP
jgi:hypothetical protein